MWLCYLLWMNGVWGQRWQMFILTSHLMKVSTLTVVFIKLMCCNTWPQPFLMVRSHRMQILCQIRVRCERIIRVLDVRLCLWVITQVITFNKNLWWQWQCFPPAVRRNSLGSDMLFLGKFHPLFDFIHELYRSETPEVTAAALQQLLISVTSDKYQV